MSQNKKIIEKLKKLFALGQSSNQHEAELAMAKANEIMAEYQISITDIDLSEEGDVGEESICLEGEGKKQLWITRLAFAAALMYDCKVTYTNTMWSPGLLLRFYGTQADILASQMTFKHLYASWKSIVLSAVRSTKPVDTKRFRRSHGAGYANAITNRVSELVKERNAKVKSATGRDLVVVKGAAVDAYMSNMKFGAAQPSTAKIDADAYYKGRSSGEAIALHGAISEEKPLAISSSRNQFLSVGSSSVQHKLTLSQEY